MRYKVYRSNINDFIPSMDNLVYEMPVLKEGEPPTEPSSYETSFLDISATDNVRYYYKIAAVDKMGNYSYSNEVAASEQVRFGDNLVKNGSFEKWTGSKLEDWSLISNVTSNDVFKIDGNYSLQISNTRPEYSYALQTVRLEKNTDYTIVCWIKGEDIIVGTDPSGNPGAGVRIFYGIGNTSNYDGTFDWKYIHKTFNSGNNASLDFFLYMHYTTGKVYFDGFGVYKTAEIDGVPPEKPRNVVANPINGEQKNALNWQTPERAPDGGLPVKYRIYRGSLLTNMTLVEEVPATITSWVDENALGNSQNYYYVTALDKAGNESDPSEITLVDKRSNVNGKVVTLLEDGKTKRLDGVKLSIEGTELFTTSTDGLFEFKWLVEGEYVLLAQLKNYQQKKTFLSVDVGEDIVMEDIVLELDETPPNEPKNLTADGDSHVGVVILKWDEPDMAEDFEIAEAYNVYRSLTEDIQRTPQRLIATVTENRYHDIGTEKEFGKKYYYLIESIDLAGNTSLLASNIESATMIIPPIPMPISPRNRELFSEEAPVFEWEMLSNPDIKDFLIQISKDSSFPDAKTLTEDCIGLNFTWPQELEQSLWFWRIKARFNTGAKSSWSSTNEFVTISDSSTVTVPYINVVPSIFQNESVTIGYYLAKEADIELRVFDIGGKLVSNLVSRRQVAGFYEEIWTGSDLKGEELPNGLYVIQLLANSGEGKPEKILKKVVVYR